MIPVLLVAALGLGDVSSSIGVNIHFTGAPTRDLDMIRDAGFGWIRMDFSWSGIERQKGVYGFEPYDQLLDGLESRGIRALFILDYSNRLYEQERSVRTEDGRQAFARFAAAAAKRYKGRGVRWELWNEPNLEGFWKPQPAADDYADLVLSTAKAIRAVDPDAKLLAPASSGFPWPFLERIFERGVLAHIDEVSVHPYRASHPETAREDYARLRKLIAQYAPKGKPAPPIVSGEWGYSTWHHGGLPFSAEVQAKYLVRELLTNIAEGIPLSIWYDWANDGPDPKETEHNFGTVTQGREPKPAYVAAKTMTSALGKAEFERRLRSGDDEHFLVFRNGDRRTLVTWSVQGGGRVPVELGTFRGELSATRLDGRTQTVRVTDGVLDLELTDAPVYLEIPVGVEELTSHGLDISPLETGVRATARRDASSTLRAKIVVELNGKEAASREVVLPADGEITADLPVSWPATETASVRARLVSASTGRPLAAWPGRPGGVERYVDPDYLAGGADDFSASLDGDAAVGAEAKLSVVSLEGDPSAPGSKALRLEYRMDSGWRFVRVMPKKKLQQPEGRLSVWVKGDGSGNTLRCRFRDSKGETFQPSYGPVNWTGWRRIEMPLDGADAGSWGGDGKVDPPISWDSLLLIDSTRDATRGTIEFCGPLLVLPR